MRINTNINSLRTQEYMRQNQAKMSNSMDRLSSGKRINNASDDAAGLAIATRMRARESGLNVAANNTQDGMSLIRTADSALGSVSNILLRMRDLANQSANGTNTSDNQAAMQKEFAELQKQITYIADNTQFNDKNLLQSNSSINIQTLDSSDGNQQIGIELKSASLKSLGIEDLAIGASVNPLAKATVEASEAYDKAKADTAAFAKSIADTAATGTGAAKADAAAVDAYIKEADPTAKGNLYTGLTADQKKLADEHNTLKAAEDGKKAELTMATTKSTADGTAKGLVDAYDNAKSDAMNDPKAKAYLEAKMAYEKDTSNVANKQKLDSTKEAMEKDPASKDLVVKLDAAKAAATNGTPLDAVSKIDAALKTVADNRATLGATLNRLDFNVNNLKSQSSSMASAASQIEDADMAKEMSEMTKFKILNEAGISMLSQANQTPQMVSKLLQ
ncbi:MULTISPECIES: flagellin [Bacillus cereus group]|uniref:Flagellin n=1 Tax=Bacillus cereus (strain AH820) TaxID=405535 RepID=B7JIM6_BACC0|nr:MULTISPECIES: flagellin [Bacillus cereus group]ACK90907.1 A-type flagellin [Bacillus cereus AH820]MDV6363704.1 flagellin [Bacillus cereus]PEI76041.1 flagellin [Bacillus wiedmannii]PEP49568.1 flagellin [Bacillus wiedmannii]PFY96733.1 flagellin [Bacillus wiedmannii]